MNQTSIEENFDRDRHMGLFFFGLQVAEQRQSLSETNPEVVVLNSVIRSLSFIPIPPGGSQKSGILPASKASIDAMPRITVTDDCVKDCAICLDEMRVGSEMREMPCKHGFHSGCIEKWLGLHGSCPLCRFIMPVEDGGSDSDGDGSEEGRRQRRRVISYNIVILGGGWGSSDTDQN
ncbi:hypothetical protein P3X46_016433 [Hevea brasiliensis]|uniref:RING-type E3 ubiquitin transferase n=1 Tax=Hevea brasiliensis TaxID=3981 RepID=A0ABQ9LZ65_HEVBR|nr:E3 ubiquitin-protein ligase MPSR1 [Hevea brasiliensis]KAJ9173281.1 hypothetical protein P3X46_016433 [Hevea brasiliensis]